MGSFNCQQHLWSSRITKTSKTFTETASPCTKITYNYIEFAQIGILTDNIRLDTPIENNYLFYNMYGIGEYGTHLTDIENNLIFYSYYSGIEAYTESFSGQADANSHILIQNNTCDYYQDVGIYVHGTENVNYAGLVELKNNIVSGSYSYGLYICEVGEAVILLPSNTGYYDNYLNKNWDFDEYDPVEAYEFPYVAGPGHLEVCYLDQSCAFIDAGLQYIEETSLIGKTTDIYGTPDSNKIDIGYHYPDWNYSNAGSTTLQADFDNNLTVDYNDLAFFTNYWLFDYNDAYEVWWWDWDSSGMVDIGDLAVVAEYWLSPFDFVDFADFARQWQREVDYRLFDTRPDFNKDDIVNFEDFAILANEWQMTGDAEPNIIPIISGDPNSGYIEVGVSGFTSDTQRVFLFVDGEYMGEIFGFWDDYTVGIDISEFGSQDQQLKLVSISKTGQVTCSNITNVTFSCPLNYCFLPETYEPNMPVYFATYNLGPEDVSVNVYADGGNLVWSQTYDGNNIFGSIPAEITNQYEFDYVTFNKNGGRLLDVGSGIAIFKITDPVLKLWSSDPDIKALIILPNIWFRLADIPTTSIIQTAFENNGVKYKKLSLSSATHDNIAWFAQNRNIKYIYINSHGHYLAMPDSEISRTSVELWDGWTVSMKQSDFPPGSAPAWCEKLDGNLENTLKSFYTMGFTSLEFAYFDCCWSGHLMINSYNMLVTGREGQTGVVLDEPVSDMTLALGIHNPGKSRIYQGWYQEAPTAYWWTIWYPTEYQRWTQLEWEKLGEGYDLYDAFWYVIGEQTEFGRYDPVNNYRLKGQGFFFDIELNGN